MLLPRYPGSAGATACERDSARRKLGEWERWPPWEEPRGQRKCIATAAVQRTRWEKLFSVRVEYPPTWEILWEISWYMLEHRYYNGSDYKNSLRVACLIASISWVNFINHNSSVLATKYCFFFSVSDHLASVEKATLVSSNNSSINHTRLDRSKEFQSSPV